MHTRYSVISDLQAILKRYNLAFDTLDLPEVADPNIGSGDFAPIIIQGHAKKLELFQFGLIRPGTSSQRIFSVRSEGKSNPNDSWDYIGVMNVVNDSSYRPYLMKKRCVVIADAMIIGEDTDRPFLVYPRDKKRPFSLAGIYESFRDPNTGELVNTFALLTVFGNPLYHLLGLSRSPVVLDPRSERKWLGDWVSLGVHKCLRQMDYNEFNAYPISTDISKQENKKLKLLKPIGPKLLEESWERHNRRMRELEIEKRRREEEESHKRYISHQESLRERGLIP